MNKKNLTLALGVLAAFTVGSAFANDITKTTNHSTGTLVAEGEKSCKSCSGKKAEGKEEKGGKKAKKKKDKKKGEEKKEEAAPKAEEKH